MHETPALGTYPSLIPNSKNPCNVETPDDELLAGSLLSPTDLFFIRNHIPVPIVDSKEYKVGISMVLLL